MIFYLKLPQKIFDKCLKMSTISHDLYVFFSIGPARKATLVLLEIILTLQHLTCYK